MTGSLYRPALFSYAFFQNGFIFGAFVLGMVCLGHIMLYKVGTCKNWHVLFCMICTGMVHLVHCAYSMDYFRTHSNNDHFIHDSANECLDFTLPSDLANALTLALILHCVIRRNFQETPVTWLLELVCIGIIASGVFKKLHDNVNKDLVQRQDQESILTLRESDQSTTSMYWSLCTTNVRQERMNLTLEYGLIYIPVLLVVLCAISKSGVCSKNSNLLRLKILKRKCIIECDQCVCMGLNKIMITLLIYIFLLLLVIRPVIIIYSYVTSGVFRDIYPGLTNSVVFCFLCGEYMLGVIKSKSCHKSTSYKPLKYQADKQDMSSGKDSSVISL